MNIADKWPWNLSHLYPTWDKDIPILLQLKCCPSESRWDEGVLGKGGLSGWEGVSGWGDGAAGRGYLGVSSDYYVSAS